jgi:hypothetical protein
MLSKCFNPCCSTPFRYLSRGKLFWLRDGQTNSRASDQHGEWFWLCEECATKVLFTVTGRGAIVTSLRNEPLPLHCAKDKLCLQRAS